MNLLSFFKAAKPARLGLCQVHAPLTFSFTSVCNLPIFLIVLVFGLVVASRQSCSAQAAQLPAEQAASATTFVDTAGVVTHLTYTGTLYSTAWPQVLMALQNLGVHHIREGYTSAPAYSPIIQEHQALAVAGIKSTYVIPLDFSITPQAIKKLAANAQDMEAIEPPNECDMSGNCGGGGLAGIANMLFFLPMLQSAAQDLNVPLLGPSFISPGSYALAGDIASQIKVNNLHIYFGGRNPGNPGWGSFDSQGHSYGSFGYWKDQAATDAPGLPSVVTENGYISFPSTSTPYTVPESVQASYLPRTLLLSFKQGFKQTFFYQLLDEPTSPEGYGLLRSDLTPKPAFTALKNLLSLLSDQGSSFTPASLPYSIVGAGPTLNHLLLQKSDGSFWLVLWLEQSSWNPVTATPVSVIPQNIAILLNGSYAASKDYQFNATGNVVSFNQPMYGNMTSLTVTDQISIVQIVPR